MQHILRDASILTRPAIIERLRVELVILSCALAIALWMNIEASHPGTIAQLPSSLKDLGMAVWNMFLNFANSCDAALRNFVNRMSLG